MSFVIRELYDQVSEVGAEQRRYKKFLKLLRNRETEKAKKFILSSGDLKNDYKDLFKSIVNLQTSGDFKLFNQKRFYDSFYEFMKGIDFKRAFKQSKQVEKMSKKFFGIVFPSKKMKKTGKMIPIKSLIEMYIACVQIPSCSESIKFKKMKETAHQFYILKKLSDRKFLDFTVPMIYSNLKGNDLKKKIEFMYDEKADKYESSWMLFTIGQEKMDFVISLASVLSPMMSISITKKIPNSITNLIHYENDIIDVYISDNSSVRERNTIFKYLEYVYYSYKILFNKEYQPGRKKIKIILVLTEESKEFLKPLDSKDVMVFKEDDVNSGATGTLIFIFRKEEILKLIIHECLHYFDLDENLYSSKEFNSLFSYENSIGSDDPNFMEAVTETLTVVIKSLFHAKETNQVGKIEKFIQNERDFSLFQTAKIMYLAGFDSYNDFVNGSKNKKIYIQTGVIGYHIQKAALLRNIDKFLEIYFTTSIFKDFKSDFEDFKTPKTKLLEENMKILKSKKFGYERFQEEAEKLKRNHETQILSERKRYVKKSKVKLIEKLLEKELRINDEFKKDVNAVLYKIKKEYDESKLFFRSGRMTLIENRL